MAATDSNSNSNECRFELGYWKTRNIGEPARLMLAYRDIEWKDTVYTQGNHKDPFDRSSWYNKKYNLNFDFPNLPYLIDNKNGLRLTESRAIYQYLARQLNIGCFEDPLQAKQEMLASVVYEMYNLNMDLTYGFTNEKENSIPFAKEFFKAKEIYINETLPQKLNQMECLLKKENSKWLSGDDLCYADFHFWYYLDINLNLDLKCLDKFDRLQIYYQAFKNIPSIENFLKNHPAANYPMNSKISAFGFCSDHNFTRNTYPSKL